MGIAKIAALHLQLTAVEVLTNTPAAMDGANIVTHADNSNARQYFNGGIPDITGWSAQRTVIPAGGVVDVDLLAAPSTQGPLSADGKRPRFVTVIGASTNASLITLATNITNGYTPFCGGQACAVGANGYDSQLIPETIAPVSSTSRLIRVTGSSGDAFDLGILWG